MAHRVHCISPKIKRKNRTWEAIVEELNFADYQFFKIKKNTVTTKNNEKAGLSVAERGNTFDIVNYFKQKSNNYVYQINPQPTGFTSSAPYSQIGKATLQKHAECHPERQ